MTAPVDGALALDIGLDAFLKSSHPFSVFTHARRTRVIIATLFIFYLAFFCLFLRALVSNFEELNSLPPVFANLESGYLWIAYLVSGLGILLAVGFLFYFLWAVLDIWGLQVCLSPVELRVQNTITMNLGAKLMGVGSISMDAIEEIRGARFLTYVSGKGRTVRFSPVDQVDSLIAGILTHAPNTRIVE